MGLGVPITREQVYGLLGRAVKRGFVRLCAPLEQTATRDLCEQYPHANFRVVNVSDARTAAQHVASEGADLVLSLIKQVGRKKKTVQIGLAAGYALQILSQQLAYLMRAEPKLPNIVLQALSSGLSLGYPTRAPIAFFSFFEDLPIDVKYVGLFSSAVVQWDEYERTKQLPGIREAFEKKEHIDIIVVSMASADDEHGLYNHFMEIGAKSAPKILRNAGWVGDVHWRPFSKDGPINVNTGVRSMTLFELEELVEWANRPNKHVVLLAAPCAQCGKSKSKAIKPLLEEPNLRVFNHLLTDIKTARELL